MTDCTSRTYNYFILHIHEAVDNGQRQHRVIHPVPLEVLSCRHEESDDNEPDNQKAKDLLADVFEQIGYQQETPGLRNSYLSGAFELRSGIPEGAQIDSAGPDVVRVMSTELFLNFLGIRMDSRKIGDLEFTMNLITPDNEEQFLVELSNATLTNIKGFVSDNPDLEIIINRTDLEQVMAGEKSLAAQIEDGTAKVTGDAGLLQQLAAAMVEFNPRFEIMPGTAGPDLPDQLNDYEVGIVEMRGE